MNRRLLKTITDIMLLAGLVAMGVTGIGMYLAPSGKIAKATSWTFLGLDRHSLGNVHTYLGFSMLAIGLLHLTLNWKPLKTLLKGLSNSKKDVAQVAATFSLLMVGLVVYLNIQG